MELFLVAFYVLIITDSSDSRASFSALLSETVHPHTRRLVLEVTQSPVETGVST